MDCLGESTAVEFVHHLLPETERARVHGHLDQCEACRELVAHLAAAEPLPPGALPDAPEEPGRLGRGDLVDRYLILERIGTGAMGVVYSAYDPALDRKVALKLLRPRAAPWSTAKGRERLAREGRAMAKLSHPNVVAVYDVGFHEAFAYVAMELVEGVTLAEWLRQSKRSAREILRILHPCGLALGAAHAAGLIHRDFKPENVLVGHDGRVRVCDFGLARLGGPGGEGLPANHPARAPSPDFAETQTGALLGTPRYMSPEQLSGRPVTPHTDQFSFCVCLYEALFGTRPFDGDSLVELADAVCSGRVRPPSDRGVPARITRAVLRGLRVSAEERFPSMEALLDALDGPTWLPKPKVLVQVSLASLLAAGAVALFENHEQHARMCTQGASSLGTVWDLKRRAGIQRALLGTGKPFAAAAWSRVEDRVDAYARAWVAMQIDACEATRVRGTQSEHVLDLRMSCLARRLKDLDATAAILERADPDIAAQAVQLVDELPRLESCADLEALSSPVPPPDDAAKRAQIGGLRERLSHLRSAVNAGLYAQSRAEAMSLASSAGATQYRPIEGEAFLALGELQYRNGEFAASEESLHRAAQAAGAGRDLSTAALALAELGLTVAHRSRYEEALRWSDYAQSALEQVGGSAAIEADRMNDRGLTLSLAGRHEEALKAHQEAAALYERTQGTMSSGVLNVVNNQAIELWYLRRYDDALVQYQRALELGTRILGGAHPKVAGVLGNMALLANARGEWDRAEELNRKALALREEALRPDHPSLGANLLNLASVLRAQGKYREALESNARAATIFEAAGKADGVARAKSQLGDVLLALGRLDEAESMYRLALEHKERALGPAHPDVCSTLLGLSTTQQRLGRPGAALELARRALQIETSAYDEKSANLIEPLTRVAEVLRDQGGGPEALHLLSRAMELAAAGATSEAERAVVLSELGQTELALGRAQEALLHLERALELKREADPYASAALQFALARALAATARDSKRIDELAEGAVRSWEQVGARSQVLETTKFLHGRRGGETHRQSGAP